MITKSGDSCSSLQLRFHRLHSKFNYTTRLPKDQRICYVGRGLRSIATKAFILRLCTLVVKAAAKVCGWGVRDVTLAGVGWAEVCDQFERVLSLRMSCAGAQMFGAARGGMSALNSNLCVLANESSRWWIGDIVAECFGGLAEKAQRRIHKGLYHKLQRLEWCWLRKIDGKIVKDCEKIVQIVHGWKEHLKSNPVIPIKPPYDRVKRCRERKINIKASERVNVDVFTQNKRHWCTAPSSPTDAEVQAPRRHRERVTRGACILRAFPVRRTGSPDVCEENSPAGKWHAWLVSVILRGSRRQTGVRARSNLGEGRSYKPLAAPAVNASTPPPSIIVIRKENSHLRVCTTTALTVPPAAKVCDWGVRDVTLAGVGWAEVCEQFERVASLRMSCAGAQMFGAARGGVSALNYYLCVLANDSARTREIAAEGEQLTFPEAAFGEPLVCIRAASRSSAYVSSVWHVRLTPLTRRLNTHQTPCDRVKRCRERKIHTKASERVNVDVFTLNKRPCPQHGQTQFFSHMGVVQDDAAGFERDLSPRSDRLSTAPLHNVSVASGLEASGSVYKDFKGDAQLQAWYQEESCAGEFYNGRWLACRKSVLARSLRVSTLNSFSANATRTNHVGYIEPIRVKLDENGAALGDMGWGNGTILTCENPGVIRRGLNPDRLRGRQSA
ncbi:hypothetical protein PR048_013985 [Dryococelus australis]|uniref:Uncharacterized protein n=1 Tax=Dryococelus australis TaxID=614101 RepID=A0ABQ9HU78_9NEOP|nr:hypothetical protein PR048_013985 [Dryococelus australis]